MRDIKFKRLLKILFNFVALSFYFSMRRFVLFLIALPLLAFCPVASAPEGSVSHQTAMTAEAIYEQAGLQGLVDRKVFEQAYAGFLQVEGRKKDILTLVDFSKPSTAERLIVVDLNEAKLLFHSHVAHGKASGGTYATSFSNQHESHKSSLGFYLTADTYNGRTTGYSLRLDGLDRGLNDNARARGVVMHGADYADPALIASGGRLGRSFGCPALPPDLGRPIIDAIKGGSVLYIYAPTSLTAK